MTHTPTKDLDFEQYKAALKKYLSEQDRFKDFDFDGSNISVLLDILSYNTFQNAFYNNMILSEMFLDSAQTRGAIHSHAKELGYLPGSTKASTARVEATLGVTGSPSFVNIPRYTTFTARAGGRTFPFVNLDTVTIQPIDGKYCAQVTLHQGKINTQYSNVTGDVKQTFQITSDNVDISTLRVYVRETSDPNSKRHEYVLKNSILGVGNDDHVFYVETNYAGSYQVVFGRNIFGKSPVNGNVVEITALVTDGEDANGLKSFSSTSDIGGYPTSLVTVARSEGGAPPESDESVKFFATRAIQIQDRAVTENDYEILLKNRFPEIQAVSVYGGEELDPPQYGRVMIAVDVKDAEGLSTNSKERFRQFLEERNPLTIEPVIVTPKFMYLSVDTTIYYNTETTSKTSSDIRETARLAILDYSENNLSDFKKTLRFSKLLQAIDDADTNIISNDTSVQAIIEINPPLGKPISYNFRLQNELKSDHPLGLDESATNHVPAIKSSVFTFEGRSGFLMDDGRGNINIAQIKDDKFVFLKNNIGTIDYQTGDMRLSSMIVEDYSGSGVKIFAETRNKDVKSPKDRIITIRNSDINIRVVAARDR